MWWIEMWRPFWTLLLKIILRDFSRIQNRIMRIIRQGKIWHSSAVVDLHVITSNTHIYWQLHFTSAERMEIEVGTLVNTTSRCFCLVRLKTNLTIRKTRDSCNIWWLFLGLYSWYIENESCQSRNTIKFEEYTAK